LDCSTITEIPTTSRPIRLIENRSRVDVWALQQCGALMDGATTELWAGLRGYQLATHAPNLWIGETRVLVIWDEQGRTWFECPACGRRCKHLYFDELTCRICLRLDYSSRHLHRTVPGIHRIRQLRQRIGADPRPFAPLPSAGATTSASTGSLMRSGYWSRGSSAISATSTGPSSAASESARRRASGSHTENPTTF